MSRVKTAATVALTIQNDSHRNTTTNASQRMKREAPLVTFAQVYGLLLHLLVHEAIEVYRFAMNWQQGCQCDNVDGPDEEPQMTIQEIQQIWRILTKTDYANVPI